MESIISASVACNPSYPMVLNRQCNIYRLFPCTASYSNISHSSSFSLNVYSPRPVFICSASKASGMASSTPQKSGVYTVGDFMTKKENLHVVKTSTNVSEALETLVNKRISGFPVIDDDWKLVGVVSDYDLLALDSISGTGEADANLFPDVDSTWKTFNEIQKLLSKNNGKVIGDLMTPTPLVVRKTTNLGDAVRLLLETKYHRLPVVDGGGRLVGILTRGDVIRAALQIKRANEAYHN